MDPKISVIMSVYKESLEWIQKSIDSILMQSFDDFEFIIVVDNPYYEEVNELLKEYESKDNRVIIIQNKVNIGLTKSLNKAIHRARGKYIARMDADDISLENRFDVQFHFLENNSSYGVCTPVIDVIDEHDDTIMCGSGNMIYDQSGLIWECNIVHPGIMMRRDLLKLRDPLYNEIYRTSQDYELWTFLTLNRVLIMYLGVTLLKYRHSKQQIGNSRRQEQYKNFRIIRRSFITKYLDPLGEKLNVNSSANEVLEFIKQSECKTYSKNYLDKIVYLLYYSLILGSRKKLLYFHWIGWIMFRFKTFYLLNIVRLLWSRNPLPKFEY